MAVTFEDIAKRVGVSKMSVSRAFRGSPKCGAALRAEILAAAEAMGYRPDPMQSLRMTKLRSRKPGEEQGTVIGFLDMSREGIERNPSNRRILTGTRARAAELGLAIDIFAPVQGGYDLRRLRRILDARNVHGLIVGPMPEAHTRLELDFSGLAAVAIGFSMEFPDIHRVSYNHYQGTWDVMAHWHGKGMRRIGMAVERSMQERVGQRWHAAYFEFCRTHRGMAKIPSFEFDWFPGGWEARHQHDHRLIAWVKKHRPEVVLSMSPWFIEAFLGAGLKVPGDLCYCDLDDYPGKSHFRYPAVDQGFEQMGAAAVDGIMKAWACVEYGVPADPHTILLSGKIVTPD